MTPIQSFRCTFVWSLLAGITALASLPAQGKPAADAADAKGAAASRAATTVAVVDIETIYQNYPRAIKAREQVDELKNEYRRELNTMQQANDALLELVKALREGSPERRAKHLEWQAGKAFHDKKQELYEDVLSLEGARVYAAAMDEIGVAIGKVARDRGVQIVLQAEKPIVLPENVDPKSEKAVSLRMRLLEARKVWYAAEEVDLTAAVIKYLQAATPEMLGIKPERPAAEAAPKAPAGGGQK